MSKNKEKRKMKNRIILALGIVMIFATSCQQKKSDSKQLKTETITNELKVEQNKIVFENLDRVLSPFEDMTEYALNSNKNGILKSMSKVIDVEKKGLFEQNITIEGNQLLKVKLEKLQDLINQDKYAEIAIASADIFEMNINNFIDGKIIENQIQIEHLDYMGFKILALLNQDNIDWDNIVQTIHTTQAVWLSLNPKVKDTNLKDSFDYLFEGLILGTKNKDTKICKILSNMDLSLVDVLENSI